MNKLGVAILLWAALGLELSVKPGLALGSSTIAPSFALAVLTFIALFAPPTPTRWVALLLGLAVDACAVLAVRQEATAGADTDLRVLGPHAIAFVVGAQLILSIRHTTMRRNPLTMGFVAMLASIASQIVLIAIFSLRAAAFDPIAWPLWHELATRLASAAYTGVLAWGLAFLLLPLAKFLGLQVSATYATTARMSRFN